MIARREYGLGKYLEEIGSTGGHKHFLFSHQRNVKRGRWVTNLRRMVVPRRPKGED